MLTYRFKDGTEITGETNNALMLTSLTAADAGLYKCSATASVGSPPPVMSDEALLTISGTHFLCNLTSDIWACLLVFFLFSRKGVVGWREGAG